MPVRCVLGIVKVLNASSVTGRGGLDGVEEASTGRFEYDWGRVLMFEAGFKGVPAMPID
jgi:hypothetical protein